ncbi:universal stress protein Sll1388-like [Manihot esculenta]|uniref:universal stress protein Sll1388-like n=1 Tax=Manihot esculenta TaxID=3983 RepID=UPI001CC3C1F2|nr:universal stress protein Sll1388-like [Manihot esculenta]
MGGNTKTGRKVVVAVDESNESMHALSRCLANLVSPTSKLVLLYVKPPPPIYSAFDVAGFHFYNSVISSMEKYSKDLVNSVMERAKVVYKNFNVKVERAVGSGEAKDVICNTVEKLGADILVMGSHCCGFLKRALIGSVSDHCAQHVKCLVVIVKNPEEN